MPAPQRGPQSPQHPATPLLPWWAALLCAVVSFAALGWLASDRVTHPDSLTQRAAAIAEIVVPIAFLAWAIIAFIRNIRTLGAPGAAPMPARKTSESRDAGAARNAPSNNANVSDIRMSWGQFELLVVEAFRRRGCRVTERGTAASDGSMNLELSNGEHRFVVHCKQWRAKEVGIGALRELNSVMIVTNASGGFVVTTGNYSAEARTFAAGRNIQLIDGPTLREMLRDPETVVGGAHVEGAVTILPTGIPTIITMGPTQSRA
jgi:restriction system protein